MTILIKVTCGDGVVLRLPQDHFERSIFNNPDIAASRSYTLQCQARSAIVNAVLDAADGDFENVAITEDNFEELQNLCKELGFRGLDKQFRAFRGEIGSDPVDPKEFFQLKARVTRQDKRLTELEHRLSEVLSLQRKSETEIRESVSRQFQSLDRKVDDLARFCEERNVEVSQKMEKALKNCAKQSSLEELARDVAQLKQNEKTRPPVTESATQELPPVEARAKPRDPTLEQVRTFVCQGKKEKEKLGGIVAYLTREIGGNVHDKGIVTVMGTGWAQRQAVDFKDKDYYYSECKDSWICYNFNNRRVTPTSYSVKSSDNENLKSWIIEVSNDGYSWAEIDRQENNNDLKGKGPLRNFRISRVPSECFRFFRLRQIGANHDGKYGFAIRALEIFGTLFTMEKSGQPHLPKQEFVYHADRERQFPPPLFPPNLDGVIAHLTLECGGNVHDKGIVEVTASSYAKDATNAVDLGADSYYSSTNEPNSWICYDFKNRRVIPTSYSVRSCVWGPGGEHLKSWVIEVSNTGTKNSWREIDRRDNDNLNDKLVTVNFKISKVPSEGFRLFRLRQAGKNHGGKDYLKLSSLEIFGTLFEESGHKSTGMIDDDSEDSDYEYSPSYGYNSSDSSS